MEFFFIAIMSVDLTITLYILSLLIRSTFMLPYTVYLTEFFYIAKKVSS